MDEAAEAKGGSGWVLLAALTLFLIIPALVLPNPFGTDGPVHTRWQAAFAREFWNGHLVPGWLPSMNQGFGSPAFFYYPPMLQWVASLFAPILPGDALAIRRLALAMLVFSIVGAQGCRSWLRALGASDTAALLAGALWLVAPYRAFVESYQRCALASCASLGVLPWLGVAAVRLAQGRRGAWSLHAIAIALLAYTHMPGMLIGYLFAAAHGLALVLAETDRRLRLALLLGTSALTGLAIAGAMLVPALSLLGQIVDPTAMFGERAQPHNWLLFSGHAWPDPVARQLALAVMLLTLLMTAVLGPWAVRPAGTRAVACAMIATVLVVFLLNLGISRPIWDLHTPLRDLQFPWRMLGASGLAACILGGLAYDRGPKWRRSALWLLFALVLLIDMSALAYQRLRPGHNHPPTADEILQSNVDTSEYVLGDLPAITARFGNRLAFAPDDAAVAIDRAAVYNRHIAVAYRARATTALALHQYRFTGWQCRIDRGEWHQAGTFAVGAARVPLCTVPGGAHLLEARLPASRPETLGAWLTILGLAIAGTAAYRAARAANASGASGPERRKP